MIAALERPSQQRNGCDAPSLNGSVVQELRNAGFGSGPAQGLGGVSIKQGLSRPDMAFCTQGWNVRTARWRPLRISDISRSNAGHKSQPAPLSNRDREDGGSPQVVYYNQINIFGLVPPSWKPKAPDSQF